MKNNIDDDLRNSVPKRLLGVKLPCDDDRTTFVACSTYAAIDGKARHHSKITKEEAKRRSQEAIGKLLTDYHNNERIVGKIIDAELDNKNRIWIVGAIDYTDAGSYVLHRMRKGHYIGVSWRMKSFSYRDIDDGDIQVEKMLVNLSVTSNPEYPETKILIIDDDPFFVKKNNALNQIDNSLREKFLELEKKQIVLNTESDLNSVSDNSSWRMTTETPATSIPAAATTTPTEAVASATTSATTTTTTTPQNVDAQKQAVESAQKQTADPATKPPVEQTTPPSQPTPVFQPPVVNYNFGFAMPPQNQFPSLSSAQNSASQSSQTQSAMSNTTDQKPAATPAAAEQPTTTTTSTPATAAATPSFTDDLRKSILNEVRSTVSELFKQIQQPQTQPPQQQQQQSAVQTQLPAQTQQPAEQQQQQQANEEQVQQVNLNALHDTIRQIVQQSEQLRAEELAVDVLSSNPLSSPEMVSSKKKQVDEMRDEMFAAMQTLIEGVEKHYNIYTTTLSAPKSERFAHTIARLKGKVANRKPLTEDEMNALGWTIELTSESSGKHRQTLEEAERQIQQQRLAMQQSSAANSARTLAGKFSHVNQLRQVLSLDPVHNNGQMQPPSTRAKRAIDESDLDNSRRPEQKKAALTPTQAFQQKTGLPWTLADPAQFPHAPTKPAVGLHVLSQELGIKLQPVRECKDSIWANGLCNDPSFSSLISEGMEKISKGIDVYNYTPNILEFINNQNAN